MVQQPFLFKPSTIICLILSADVKFPKLFSFTLIKVYSLPHNYNIHLGHADNLTVAITYIYHKQTQ
jgi:hypothetical protein